MQALCVERVSLFFFSSGSQARTIAHFLYYQEKIKKEAEKCKYSLPKCFRTSSQCLNLDLKKCQSGSEEDKAKSLLFTWKCVLVFLKLDS